MKYVLDGKNIKIPDEEIRKSMQLLDISKEEATRMYLEDEGFLDNEEQNELEAKAKKNRITATIHKAGKGEKKKPPKPRTVKVSNEKQELFMKVHNFLSENYENVKILKENKLLEVQIGDKTIKIDLIQTKKK